MVSYESILAVCFWCSVTGVLYTYLGYPIVIYCFSRLFGREPAIPSVADDALPCVAILIAAYNEAEVIEQRILNALASTYPPDRLQIVIASDGSDDATVAICRRYEPRVRVFAFPERRGKAATLNAAVAALDADIVILSDANTLMDSTAARCLASWFTEPTVGVVCGQLVLTDSVTGRNADGLYWRYETFLKRCEGRLDGLLGANGAIYGIRRELFIPLPRGTMIDDFMVPLAAKLRTGCRIVYDPCASAREETAPDLKGEFRRRSRIGVGGFQALCTLWPLLGPKHGWTAFTFWSHKVLRWACPLFMIGSLVSTIALSSQPGYLAALIAQLAFYGLCGVIVLFPATCRMGFVGRVLRLLPMFACMNLALLVGFVRGMRGHGSGIWNRTARSAC